MSSTLNKIIIKPLSGYGTATARPITKYCWGWWEGLVPTGTYSCYLDKNGLKCWRPDNCPLIDNSQKTEDKKELK
jgi:hypothetical protein